MIVLWRWVLSARLGFGDDEAYYWDWGQHLSLSYFDHPPLVGWLSAIPSWLGFTSEGATRFPFFLLGLLSAIGLYQIALAFSPRREAWLKTLVWFALVPIYSLGSLMVFPDIPMITAWIWVLNLSLKLQKNPERLTLWLLLGAVSGLTVLSKLTGFLLFASLATWLLFTPELNLRKNGWKAGLAIAVALVMLIPILLWNLREGFPTFRFQLWERHQHQELSFSRWLQFITSQVLLLSPLFFVLGFKKFGGAFKEARRSASSRWLLCFAGPALIVFFLQPLRAAFLLHWPAPAYLPLLAAMPWLQGKWAKINLAFMVFINFAFLLMCSYPVLSALNRSVPGMMKGFEPRNEITNDFFGGSEVGPWLKRNTQDLYAKNQKPLFLTSRYQLAGSLTYYTGESFFAYGPRANAYMFFAGSPYKNEPSWLGRTVVFVADNRYTEGPETVPKLKSCRSLGEPLPVYRGDFLARTFTGWVCRWADE